MTDTTTCILIPVHDDWESLAVLLERLDAQLVEAAELADVVVVDDASRRTAAEALRFDGPLRAIRSVRSVRLARNLGHQRAIAIGLCRMRELEVDVPIVIMDADGEDDPADVPILLRRYRAEEGRCIVFARRERRSEDLVFRILYAAYRTLHRVLTGRGIRVGNFSVIPPTSLTRLTVMSETWNHYAAAVMVSRWPHVEVPTERASRIAGHSRMNLVELVTHGLSAISVYGPTVGTRLLLGTAGLVVAALIAAAWSAVRGWGLFFAGWAAIIALSAVQTALLLTFFMLHGRSAAGFMPIRDHGVFVLDEEEIWAR